MRESRGQLTGAWPQAEGVLRGLVRAVAAGRASGRGAGRPVIVGITGPVGSGKTTIAARLVEGVGGVVLSTDHYLPDYDGLREGERDEPGHADLALLAEHLASLGRGEAVERPVWSFRSHSRVGFARVEPGPLIVCEGIFSLHGAVRAGIDVGVFVEAPAAVRRARWERIEASGERGWGIERARRYFATVAEPTFARFAGEYRAAADLVIVNGGSVQGAQGE